MYKKVSDAWNSGVKAQMIVARCRKGIKNCDDHSGAEEPKENQTTPGTSTKVRATRVWTWKSCFLHSAFTAPAGDGSNWKKGHKMSRKVRRMSLVPVCCHVALISLRFIFVSIQLLRVPGEFKPVNHLKRDCRWQTCDGRLTCPGVRPSSHPGIRPPWKGRLLKTWCGGAAWPTSCCFISTQTKDYSESADSKINYFILLIL